MKTGDYIELEHRRGANNYHPLPVVVESAEGAWITDVDGRRYLDFLSAYSALNFGHRNPRLIAAAQAQLNKVTLTSRAVHSAHLGAFCEELADLVGQDRILPMNSGAEAVESAIKVCRAWGYRVKGVPANEAVIIVCHGNFHGRTTTIISFSDDPDSYTDFGPFTPGFVSVDYGDITELRGHLGNPNVVAFIVEPIQGEAGVVVPRRGISPRRPRHVATPTCCSLRTRSNPGSRGRHHPGYRARGSQARRRDHGQGAGRRDPSDLRDRDPR